MQQKLPLPFFPLFISLIFIEFLIFLWFLYSVDQSILFEKCARNSGRVSAAINLILITLIAKSGLKNCFSDAIKRDNLIKFSAFFAINHLIHFFFIYQTFSANNNHFEFSKIIHGLITFGLILIMPLLLHKSKKSNFGLMLFIVLHFLNTTYFISETFYARIKPGVPEYLHQIGIILMIAVAIMMVLKTLDNYSKKTIAKW